MYLTRMKLDLTKRKTMLALAEPNLFHGIVESAFEGTRQRKLWRLDPLNGSQYLMILSADIPDLRLAVQQLGCDNEITPYETKDYNPLLARIQEGMNLRFRLTANPVISIAKHLSSGERAARGEVKALIPAQQKMWLSQRAEKHGFSLLDDEFDVTKSQRYQFFHGKQKATLLSVTYEGLLKVNNADLFREMLISGIGRGKAYGMGLMTVLGTC